MLWAALLLATVSPSLASLMFLMRTHGGPEVKLQRPRTWPREIR